MEKVTGIWGEKMNTRWRVRMNGDPILWPLESDPWATYRIFTDLLNRSASDSDVQEACGALLKHPKVGSLLDAASQWFPESITRHNDPTLSHYTLSTLAEFGLKVHDPGMNQPSVGILPITKNLPLG